MRVRMTTLLLAAVTIAPACQPSTSVTTVLPRNLAPDSSNSTRVLFAANDTSVEAAVEQSSLIFEGTVLSADSTAPPLVMATGRVMTTHVGRVLRTPAGMGDFAGDTVTIVAQDSSGLSVGGHAVFFTYGLVAGTKLVVQEVKRILVGSDSAVTAVQARIGVADSTITDRRVVANAQRADAVVLVTVDSLLPVKPADSLARLASEHTPRWKLSVGHVTKAFRVVDTLLVKRPVATLFAAGGTTLTENAPQLLLGEPRILWLHRLSRLPATLRAGIDTSGRYFVIEQDDMRPAADSMRVIRALRSAGIPVP